MNALNPPDTSALPELFRSMSRRKLRFILLYLHMTLSPEDAGETFGSLITTGTNTLKIEWIAYDPAIATRHKFCRITTGKIHDIVVEADKVIDLCNLLVARIAELKKAES